MASGTSVETAHAEVAEMNREDAEVLRALSVHLRDLRVRR
jgi:hypothetical protein